VPIPGAGTGAKATQGKNDPIYIPEDVFKFAMVFGSFKFSVRISENTVPLDHLYAHLIRNICYILLKIPLKFI